MSMMWVGLGSAVLGAGTSLYGANKQSKANQSAQDQNAALQREQNAAAWANYLMSRGVNPAGATTGQIPTNPQAINAKLPLWASARFAQPSAQKTWRKKGAASPGTLVRNPSFAGGAPAESYAMPAQPSGGSSRTNDLLIGNPLGIGGKDRSFLDPLGIF